MSLSEIMKVGVLVEPHKFEIKEIKLEDLGENDVLVEQKTCNICTTDYTQFQGLRNHQGWPMAGGHEGSGVVKAVGSKVRNVDVGDHVVVMCSSCGICNDCREGNEGLCYQNDLITYVNKYGFYGSCGFADKVILNEVRLLKVNKNIAFNEAGFLEPLATVVKGQKLLEAQMGETIVIIGAGTMGLLNAMFYRSMSCKVILTELMDNKISHARKLGFEVIDVNQNDPIEKVLELTEGKGADSVILAVGNSIANEQAMKMVKKNYGKISYFAASYPEPVNEFSSNLIHYKRMKIIGTTGADYADFIDAIKLMNTELIDFSVLLEKKKFKLDDINQAFEYASIPGKYRVTVEL